LLHRRDELIKRTPCIRCRGNAALPQSKVEWVVEQRPGLFVPTSDNDRQAVLRRNNTGTGRAQSEFSRSGMPIAAGAEIPQPEDTLGRLSLTIKRNVLVGPSLESSVPSRGPAPAVDRQIDAARLAEDVAEFLARLADRRRIHNRHIGRRIRHQHRVNRASRLRCPANPTARGYFSKSFSRRAISSWACRGAEPATQSESTAGGSRPFETECTALCLRLNAGTFV